MSTVSSKIERLKEEMLLMQEKEPGLKPNFSAMARETGISRQTIAKIWKDLVVPKTPRQKRKSKFDPYSQEIKEKFESGRYSVKAVFKSMQAKYPEIFTSYSSFKHHVRSKELKDVRKEFLKAQVRDESEPE